MSNIIIPEIVRAMNRTRANKWHPPETDDWTLGDWSNAMCGEAGELANVVKKIRRHQSGASVQYNTPEMAELRAKAAEECADVLLYLDLLMWKAGLTPGELERALIEKFNAVSVAQGWDYLTVLVIPTGTAETTKTDAACAECGQPLGDVDPHTRDDGEAVHPQCCPVCYPRDTRRVPHEATNDLAGQTSPVNVR